MLHYPRGMTSNIVPSTMRVKKSRALAKKRSNAASAGVTLIEGSLVAIMGTDFAVYEWSEAEADYVITHRGRLDTA